MWRSLLVFAGACYRPVPPVGAVCDPAAPRCPDDQVCTATPQGHFCGVPVGDLPDAPPDAIDPGDPFAHVTLAPGWTVELHRDLTEVIAFDAMDFADSVETYDNAPDWLFVLDEPFARGLGLVAGRRILEVGPDILVHDFGQHAPNTANQPDDLRGAVFVAARGTAAAQILASSSSSGSGDGTFTISPAWEIDTDNAENNVRNVTFDPGGTFDDPEGPEGYLATDHGLLRRSDDALIAGGDFATMRVAGAVMLATRTLPTSVQLVSIASTTHAETVVAERSEIRLVEGVPPANALTWAIVDERRLVLVDPDGGLVTIAETTDPAYVWHTAAAPAPPHPLAGAVYLVESNRTLGLDRIVTLRAP